jgi:hypothetical protein
MGGVSLADDNMQIANPINPATYTGLKLGILSNWLGIRIVVTIKSSTSF